MRAAMPSRTILCRKNSSEVFIEKYSWEWILGESCQEISDDF